jgi:signal transduction histidine kinase
MPARGKLRDMQKALAVSSRLNRIHWNQDWADMAMAFVITAVTFGAALAAHGQIDPVSAALLFLQSFPVIWRRRYPMPILVVTGLSITAYSLLGYPQAGSGLGVFLAFYTVAAHEPRTRAVVAAALTAGGIFLSFAAYAATGPGWTAGLATAYLSFGLAWLIGDNLRVRRAYTRQLEQRAAELEIEREEKAALAVSQERARIARELHDVVAHHVSVMVVQAAAARRVCDKDKAQAKDALEAVEESGRTALAEMRRMLEVLRTDTAGVGPQPGLSELDRLIAQVRETGLPVETAIEGTPNPLPVGMDLAAYRIIQEALTNVVKHAGKANARVRVRYAPDTLDIEITDDGRGAAAPLLTRDLDGGHGLIGMQERVALYEGTLETGPLFPGGYRVHAHFPLEPAPKKSRAECCDEDSALSKVAAEAKRKRERSAGSLPLPKPPALVSPRVVPPMIGRVVPPHLKPEPRSGRRERPAGKQPTRQTPPRAQAQPQAERDASRSGDTEP